MPNALFETQDGSHSLFSEQLKNLSIQYTGIEAFPISIQQASNLNYSALLKTDHYQASFLEMHRTAWARPVQITDQFQFTKHQIKFETIGFSDQFDIIYFDAFAPNAQPELWEADLLGKMYQALKKEGVLVTYCAKGVVKRTLKAVGFEIEALKGPPGKREMTRAIKR